MGTIKWLGGDTDGGIRQQSGLQGLHAKTPRVDRDRTHKPQKGKSKHKNKNKNREKYKNDNNNRDSRKMRLDERVDEHGILSMEKSSKINKNKSKHDEYRRKRRKHRRRRAEDYRKKPYGDALRVMEYLDELWAPIDLLSYFVYEITCCFYLFYI